MKINKQKNDRVPLDEIPEVREMLAKQAFTTSLNPVKAEEPLSEMTSKFGGVPIWFGGKWPECPACKRKLLFVLQLLKQDFRLAIFDAQTEVFQLFRCENENCPENYNGRWDQLVAAHLGKMFLARSPDTTIVKSVPECRLRPNIQVDFPSFWEDRFDWWGEALESFHKKYRVSGEYSEFCEKYKSIKGTKIGGFPAWQQIPDFPVCNCGKRKQFLFQLASGDDGKSFEPHGVMIGDAGNIYFFVCPDCGSASLETRWDCG